MALGESNQEQQSNWLKLKSYRNRMHKGCLCIAQPGVWCNGRGLTGKRVEIPEGAALS